MESKQPVVPLRINTELCDPRVTTHRHPRESEPVATKSSSSSVSTGVTTTTTTTLLSLSSQVEVPLSLVNVKLSDNAEGNPILEATYDGPHHQHHLHHHDHYHHHSDTRENAHKDANKENEPNNDKNTDKERRYQGVEEGYDNLQAHNPYLEVVREPYTCYEGKHWLRVLSKRGAPWFGSFVNVICLRRDRPEHFIWNLHVGEYAKTCSAPMVVEPSWKQYNLAPPDEFCIYKEATTPIIGWKFNTTHWPQVVPEGEAGAHLTVSGVHLRFYNFRRNHMIAGYEIMCNFTMHSIENGVLCADPAFVFYAKPNPAKNAYGALFIAQDNIQTIRLDLKNMTGNK